MMSHLRFFTRTIVACSAALLLGLDAHANAQGGAGETAAMLAAIRDHVAADADGTLGFDPRPIRAGADIALGLDSADFVSNPVIAAARAEHAQALGLRIADLLEDRYCTFTGSGPTPPGRVLSAEARQREGECARRGAYTTFAAELATPVVDSTTQSLTARTRVVKFTRAGYSIWRLHLRQKVDGSWCVERAEREFSIAS